MWWSCVVVRVVANQKRKKSKKKNEKKINEKTEFLYATNDNAPSTLYYIYSIYVWDCDLCMSQKQKADNKFELNERIFLSEFIWCMQCTMQCSRSVYLKCTPHSILTLAVIENIQKWVCNTHTVPNCRRYRPKSTNNNCINNNNNEQWTNFGDVRFAKQQTNHMYRILTEHSCASSQNQ